MEEDQEEDQEEGEEEEVMPRETYTGAWPGLSQASCTR